MREIRALCVVLLLALALVGCTQPSGGGAPSTAPSTPVAEDPYDY